MVAVTLGDAMRDYLNNISQISNMVDCVMQSRYESNVYKNIASFESADIVQSEDVPLGDEKQKMAYLLAEAIGKSTSLVGDNLKLAATLVTGWGKFAPSENQPQDLKNALSTLNNAVKTSPIPPYSRMSDDQRVRVQNVFKDVLALEQTPSIDYITDAIDRYNAGANYGVLANKLNVVVEHKHSIKLYDEERFEALTEDKVLLHLITRFSAFKKVSEHINANNKLSVDAFTKIMQDSQVNKNMAIHNHIKNLCVNLDFTKPVEDYTNGESATASYSDVKAYSDKNFITTLDTNTQNRLNALAEVVAKMTEFKLYDVNVGESTMDAEGVYDIMHLYFEFVEEFAQTLMVFMYVTQIALRNAVLIDEVISVSKSLVSKIDTLFEKVNETIPEDGEVSQESINAAINFVKSKLPISLNQTQVVKQQSVYGELKDRFAETMSNIERIRLRGITTFDEVQMDKFKNEHKSLLKQMFDVDVRELSSEELFNFVTTKCLSDANGLLTNNAFNIRLLTDKTSTTTYVNDLISNAQQLDKLFALPFATTGSKTYAISTQDLEYHLSNLEEDLKSGDALSIEKSVKAFDYFLTEGSYYTAVDKLTGTGQNNEFTTVPTIPYKDVQGNEYTLGYRRLDRASQDNLFAVFAPTKNALSIHGLNNNEHADSLSNNIARLYSLNETINASKSQTVKQLNSVVKRLQKIKPIGVDKTLLTALVEDVESAISDMLLRERFIKLAYETSVSLNRSSCEFYNKSLLLFTDFLNAVR